MATPTDPASKCVVNSPCGTIAGYGSAHSGAADDEATRQTDEAVKPYVASIAPGTHELLTEWFTDRDESETSSVANSEGDSNAGKPEHSQVRKGTSTDTIDEGLRLEWHNMLKWKLPRLHGKIKGCLSSKSTAPVTRGDDKMTVLNDKEPKSSRRPPSAPPIRFARSFPLSRSLLTPVHWTVMLCVALLTIANIIAVTFVISMYLRGPPGIVDGCLCPADGNKFVFCECATAVEQPDFYKPLKEFAATLMELVGFVDWI